MSDYPLNKVHIEAAMQNQGCYRVAELIGGTILKNGAWLIRFTGGYAIVFPFLKSNGDKIAVKCWWADIVDPQKRMLSIASYLSELNSNYFVKFNYYDKALIINGKLQPVVTMDYIDDPTLKEYIKENLNNQSAIMKVAENFRAMVKYFHENNLAHGDLSHGNIKVKKDGSLIVLDYDSMYVPDLNGMPDVINGIPGYQHPARDKNKTVSPKLDYFSELVIYLSLLVFADYPVLWNNYYDTEDLLFSKQDYESPNSSMLFQTLKKSTNSQISDLTKKLVNFLNHDDISDLMPLEEILKEIDDITNDIIAKM